MKKVLLAILCFISAISFCACASGGSPHEHSLSEQWSSDATHHYKTCTQDNCTEIFEKAEHVATGELFNRINGDGILEYYKKCSVCGADVIIDGQCVFADTKTAVELLKTEKDGGVIFLVPGNYGTLLLSNLKNVTVKASPLAAFDKMVVSSSSENIVIDGAKFTVTSASGLTTTGNVNGLTVKNCKFTRLAQINITSEKISDLVVDSCEFEEIMGGLRTAILVKSYHNATIKDCVFDDVEYNAMQIGENGATGKLVVMGNTFKEIGSRVIYIVKSADLDSSSIIENNIFYEEMCSTNYNTEIRKDDGAYIKCGAGGNLVVGVNTWENIPDALDKYFLNISYDDTIQLQLEIN